VYIKDLLVLLGNDFLIQLSPSTLTMEQERLDQEKFETGDAENTKGGLKLGRLSGRSSQVGQHVII
jgi:hypothetical protein